MSLVFHTFIYLDILNIFMPRIAVLFFGVLHDHHWSFVSWGICSLIAYYSQNLYVSIARLTWYMIRWPIETRKGTFFCHLCWFISHMKFRKSYKQIVGACSGNRLQYKLDLFSYNNYRLWYANMIYCLFCHRCYGFKVLH